MALKRLLLATAFAAATAYPEAFGRVQKPAVAGSGLVLAGRQVKKLRPLPPLLLNSPRLRRAEMRTGEAFERYG